MKIFKYLFVFLVSFTILAGCSDLNGGKTENISSEIPTFRIKFVVDDEVYDSKKYELGEIIKLPIEPTKEGYEFLGWYTEEDELFEAGKVSEKLTLYAKFEKLSTEKEMCEIKFYVDGKLVYNEIYEVGSRVKSLPTPENFEDKLFIGWYTNDGNQFEAGSKIYSDIILEARYDNVMYPAVMCTVNFYVDDEWFATEEYTAGEKAYNLPNPKPKLDYVFIGWYTVDDVLVTKTSIIESDMDLYARYEVEVLPENKVKINLWVNGELYKSLKYNKGSSVASLPVPFGNIPTGMTFVGWYTVDGFKFPDYEIVSETINLYAKFEGSGDPGALYYVEVYKNGMHETSGTYYSGDIVWMPTIYLDGYKFLYWEDEYSGLRYYEGENIFVYKDMKLNGIYEYIGHDGNCCININLDGMYYTTLYVKYGDKVEVPNPYKEGYEFLYWEDWNSWNRYYEYDTIYAYNDMTLNAVYEPLYFVNVNLYAEFIGTTYYKYGEMVTLPDVNKEGYQFLYWYDEYTGNIYYEHDIIYVYSDLSLISYYDIIPIPPSYYTAEFYLDGIYHSSVEYHAGDTLLLPDPYKEGYCFLYWIDEYSGLIYYGTEIQCASGSLRLNAVYELDIDFS